MILELLLNALFALFSLIIDIIPDMTEIQFLEGIDISGFIDFLAYGFLVFPFSLFILFIGNVLFWLSAQMIWAIVEWVYRKIPGVS
jgi:hypothetical protein